MSRYCKASTLQNISHCDHECKLQVNKTFTIYFPDISQHSSKPATVKASIIIAASVFELFINGAGYIMTLSIMIFSKSWMFYIWYKRVYDSIPVYSKGSGLQEHRGRASKDILQIYGIYLSVKGVKNGCGMVNVSCSNMKGIGCVTDNSNNTILQPSDKRSFHLMH